MSEQDDLTHYMEATSRMRQRAERAEARVRELEAALAARQDDPRLAAGERLLKELRREAKHNCWDCGTGDRLKMWLDDYDAAVRATSGEGQDA